MVRQDMGVTFIRDAIFADTQLRDMVSQLQELSPAEHDVIRTFTDYFSREAWQAHEALPRARTLLATVRALVVALEQETAD